ncbi:Peptidoglycan/xylan/chitin deacetylase, PgdA/CDA1 family [Filimonas lacunae]|uniref:Peptidoglycan/xylan/chitin deacetylase, PgdA/CDA1 family n=1 Tax=Filimonas lacunae TaxID=477680 RepID=A0A173MM94_9BACT|nr:polysaccharide deacetylase family protein [Filimonas lacunae]BAV08498.1 peptidoglycan N-acetylglucosamine deacetylase [Filimonas lacunae]SIT34017.1 Peptidoglycan/xylan/chitin deacetylase, PgdA/CDA1 family [Filimonas lacunae]
MRTQKTVTSSILFAAIMGMLASCGGRDKKDKAAADSTKPVVVAPAGPGTPMKLDSTKRYIYLTFDDGPQPPGTNMCKAVFHEQGVKATFFLVGMHQFDHRRKLIVDSLHNSYPEFLTANHSYSHGFKNNYRNFYTHADSAVKDFLRAGEELKIPVKIIRLPGNNNWVHKGEIRGPKIPLAVCKKLDSLGYDVIGWDVEWGFKGNSTPIQSAEKMAQEVNTKFENYTSYTPNTVVILAHDRMFASAQYADSLRRFITILKQDPRNVFETIDHYPMVQQK